MKTRNTSAAVSGREARAVSVTPREAPDPVEAGPGQVRVLCVDDHAVLVEGLKAQFALDGHVRVVGSLGSAEHLVEEAKRLHPNIVLLDIEMPGPDAFETADRLRHVVPTVRVIFLSAHIRDGYLSAAYKSGASGYFAKSDDLAAIVEGVREVAGSHRETFVMGPKVRERCRPTGHGAPRDEPPRTTLEALSPRELEVLRLIGKGMSRVQIAAELSRSAKTVDGHQDRILKKLGLSSRADLLKFAIREGLAEA